MRKRNGKWEFTNYDLMDCNGVLSDIIVDALEQFLALHDGHSFAGVPSSYLPDNSDHSEAHLRIGTAKFHEDIKKAIFAFKNEEPEYDGVDFGYGGKVDEIKWAEYCRRMDEHNALVQEGMQAFVKIFPHLWI